MKARAGRHPLVVPEVVQTSAMDCGPACLKGLLEGFGIRASYPRLREACQTDVDGTSIDTIEEVAIQLGLDAEQVIIPVDHVLLEEAGALPAMAVVRLSTGLTHFVLIWRRHGRVVQVMDPATGRRWPSATQVEKELFVHRTAVPADAWRDWAAGDEFQGALARRIEGLGVARRTADSLRARALEDSSWRSVAALDAAVRATTSLTRAGGLAKGREAARGLEAFVVRATSEVDEAKPSISLSYWFARPDPDDSSQLLLRGAVLVRARGVRDDRPDDEQARRALPIELAAALEEAPARPGRDLIGFLRADGLLAPTALLAALGLASGAVALEALLFRGMLEMAGLLDLTRQRLGALAGLGAFLVLLLGMDLVSTGGLLRMGRHLEARLRLAFLGKIPRLADAYFQSRLASDLAERGHAIQQLRLLPRVGGQLLQAVLTLLATTAGIIWLDPATTRLALVAALLLVTIPLAAQPQLIERDLRLRTHTGALGRYYLDAMLGLVPIRAHGAEGALRREHAATLAEWARAGLDLQRGHLLYRGIQSTVGTGLVIWLVFDHLARVGESGSVLLLIYWALHLPVIGEEVGLLALQYPSLRNATLRMLEPLGAPEDADGEPSKQTPAADSGQPPSLLLEGVSVRAAGHTLLREIDLRLEPGEHVAIVGPSGAGKSTLVALLLGWHRPSAGRLLADGERLAGARLDALRRHTAWVDPSVRLWNRPLLDNLRYGNDNVAADDIQSAIHDASLIGALERLPDGLQTPLGDGGALLSGGEGQRVRFARGLLREAVQLAVLDEPFRGLDRKQRAELLANARRRWRNATLLWVTHEIEETTSFPRVVVVDDGRIVEDGAPGELTTRPGSRYAALLDADRRVRSEVWGDARWTRLRVEAGRIVEAPQGPS